MRAIGFHGTSIEAAQRILSSGFEVSRNEYDWLGDGAYFFQDAPARALEWARRRFGEDAAVVGAEIDLEDCIDLLDIRWQAVLEQSYADLIQRLETSAQAVPRQTSGAHRLDAPSSITLWGCYKARALRCGRCALHSSRGSRCSPGRHCGAGHMSRWRFATRMRSSGSGELPETGEDTMIDPQRARAVLKEYYATASDQQIIDDLRRHSPELARRLGVDAASQARQPDPARGRVRGLFSSFGRSVLRLFS